MSFKGTEGKWTVIDGKASGKQVISESAPNNRMTVASCGGQRREENANLIAAAPELLEALQQLVYADCHSVRNSTVHIAALEKASAAIARALGQ